MARTSVVWSGLDEYREQLRQLPEACLGEARKAIEGEANASYVTIASVYEAHRFTGTLRRLLTLSPLTLKGQLTTGLVLKSGSPLAWLFDHGSEARHWKRNGKYVGRMPATFIFTRTVGRARRRLTEQFIALLFRHGASKVTGE